MPDVSPDYTFTNGTTADAAQVQDVIDEIVAAVNDLDADNIGASLATLLGLTAGGVTRRGKSLIAAAESRTDVAFGLLGTPDRVSGIVVPSDGFLEIDYQALWKSSVADAGQAAIFIGANQLKMQGYQGIGTRGPQVVAAAMGTGGANLYVPLFSCIAGLAGGVQGGADYADDVTTGQAVGYFASALTPAQVAFGATPAQVAFEAPVGGCCRVEVAAGTYDVSVQFKSTSGSVTVKNRRLHVRVESDG